MKKNTEVKRAEEFRNKELINVDLETGFYTNFPAYASVFVFKIPMCSGVWQRCITFNL